MVNKITNPPSQKGVIDKINEVIDAIPTTYITSTDYANSSTGGVIKTSSATGVGVSGAGVLYATNSSYATYQGASNYSFISKGTLENVLTGKGVLASSDVKTINNQSIIGTGDIDTDNIFIATYGTTTQQEILDAYNAGKACFCTRVDTTDNSVVTVPLVGITSDEISFGGVQYNTSIWYHLYNEQYTWRWYRDAYSLQNSLVSGTNIKTINSTSLLGSGNIAVQETLTSGTNIKTINGQDILGSGNLNTPNRNIGEIITSTIPLTDAGLHLLDGSLLSYASYSDFIDYIASIYDASANYFCTEADWQTSVTTYGVCGKFVYDSVNNTVRLPKITGFIEGASSVSSLGDLVQAGLPNITASVSTRSNGSTISNNGTGAFTTQGGGGYPNATVTETNNYTKTLNFDASRSNSIYGNSSTVQPQSVKVLYYIVIATTAKTDIEVDIDEIATDLNGKADTDLSNVANTAGFRKLVEIYNNGSDWYKVYREYNPSTGAYIGLWCEQGGHPAIGSTNKSSITLLREMADTNYSIQLTGINGTWNIRYNTRTTTDFTVPSGCWDWVVRGYAKESE